MSLNVIPPCMRARHKRTGDWHVLRLEGWYLNCVIEKPWELYFDEKLIFHPSYVELGDFDQFQRAS